MNETMRHQPQDESERPSVSSACDGGLAGPVGELRRIEHPGDLPRAQAYEHFAAELESKTAELCYCGTCDGYYVADPYPQECPGGCEFGGVRVNTFGYYYAFEAAHPSERDS